MNCNFKVMNDLLLLHGALGSARQLEPLAKELSSHYAVHTLNFYGHGGEAPPASYDFEGFQQDIITYLDREGLSQVDVFGYSMGGYAAMFTALNHADRIGKIATLGTKVIWTPEGSAKEVKMLNADAIEAKVPAFAAHLQQIHGDYWREVLSSTAQMMLNLGKQPALTEADYNKLSHKMLLSIGDRDHMAGLEDTVAVYRMLNNASLWVLPGTPHPLDKVDIPLLASGLKVFFG